MSRLLGAAAPLKTAQKTLFTAKPFLAALAGPLPADARTFKTGRLGSHLRQKPRKHDELSCPCGEFGN
jgi:hypothetical protein